MEPKLKERPCKNCNQTPLYHTAVSMLCPGFMSQYIPDETKEGTIPAAYYHIMADRNDYNRPVTSHK